MRDLDTRKCLYCTLVRPQLEYSSELWSPSEIKYKLMLEGVQRGATKFILNYPSDCYKERLTKLNLLPLEYRRDMKDLIFLFKCKLGLFNIELSDYVKLRPIPKYDLRAYDVNNFSEFKCRTVYFRSSYFPRVVHKWNSLESNIKYLSPELPN